MPDGDTPQPGTPARLWRWTRLALGYTLAACGALALAALALFILDRPPASSNPEALANDWVETVSQFGISPVFPPQEDLAVGDVYALLGDSKPEIGKSAGQQRLKLKLPRAIKLDHLEAADRELVKQYGNVFVLPSKPNTPPGAPQPGTLVNQVDCIPDGCFAKTGPRIQLPLVILPDLRSANRREAEISGNLSDRLFRLVGAFSDLDDRQTSITVPYAEVYGLPSLKAWGIVKAYCEDPARPGICSEDTIRQHLAMVAGSLATEETQPNSKVYVRPVYLVMISAVYVARTIRYSFSAETSTALQARLYEKVRERIESDTPTPNPTTPNATPNETTPTDPAAEARARATRDTLAAERKRLLAIMAEETGFPSGGRLNVATSSRSGVVIDQTLPRPVAIGFIPVLQRFGERTNVAEPE